jgi:outer membrane protein OmpA-like peptidoglycan-associated protein
MWRHVLSLISLSTILILTTSCTTYHFGVKDRAATVPAEFGQTEAAIAQGEQSPGAKYCPEKIAQAKELGTQAANAYWACNNTEASRLLAEARKLAKDAEGCGPAPVAAPAPEVIAPPPPPPPVKAEPTPEKICITLKIEFDYDKADIKPKYHNVIGKVADFLNKYPNTTAVIEGHTDNRGSYQYNIKLSERRADSVRNYLIEKFKIAPERLSTKGYGYTKPIASNKTAEGRQKNRRIEAQIDCIVNVEKTDK